MEESRWQHAVMLVCRVSGQIVVVCSPREAFNILSTTWPTNEGSAYFRALQACVRAADYTGTLEEARRAFLDAADEAGVPVHVSA